MATSMNSANLLYPMTSMNFVVTAGSQGEAAFSEISGIEASVDIVEFRQGNSPQLTPIKIPGLVHHGNVTLKYGYIIDDGFRQWVIKCVSNARGVVDATFRADVRVELLNTGQSAAMPSTKTDTAGQEGAGTNVWVFKDAWVTKYNGPDMNAMNSEIAIESIELAYESLIIAGTKGATP